MTDFYEGQEVQATLHITEDMLAGTGRRTIVIPEGTHGEVTYVYDNHPDDWVSVHFHDGIGSWNVKQEWIEPLYAETPTEQVRAVGLIVISQGVDGNGRPI